jgi:FkbM family methyltransferase
MSLGETDAEMFEVPGIRVDDLLCKLGGRIDFIKIDVEGAEPLVIKGARRAIETNPRLQIVMEWSPGPPASIRMI